MKQTLYLKELKMLADKVIYINYQNNSINGTILFHGEKCFFKILNEVSFFNEINGYLQSFNKLPIKKMLYTSIFLDKYILIYEYEKSLKKNKGLLNDFLVENDKRKRITNKHKQIFSNILNIYNLNLKDLKKISNSPNSIFFEKRINSRLINWYNKNNDFNKKVFYNFKSSKNTKDIILEVINYFSDNKNLNCFFSQGDPNTMNISLTPCFFDLETVGFNSILGETAIIIISTLLYDNYFCPLYHKESYYLHDKALKNLQNFKPTLILKVLKNNIYITSNIKTSNIRKKYVLQYLEILENNCIKLTEEIKYYFVMRLLCVFDLNKMNKKDYYYSLFLVHYFYNITCEDIYLDLKEKISNMEEINDAI